VCISSGDGGVDLGYASIVTSNTFADPAYAGIVTSNASTDPAYRGIDRADGAMYRRAAGTEAPHATNTASDGRAEHRDATPYVGDASVFPRDDPVVLRDGDAATTNAGISPRVASINAPNVPIFRRDVRATLSYVSIVGPDASITSGDATVAHVT